MTWIHVWRISSYGLRCEQPQGRVASPKERDPDPELHTGTGQKSQLRTRPATRPLKPAVLKSRRKGWGRSEIKVGDRRAATTGSRHLTLRASQLARIALAKMMPPTAAPATTAQHASVARGQQKKYGATRAREWQAQVQQWGPRTTHSGQTASEIQSSGFHP